MMQRTWAASGVLATAFFLTACGGGDGGGGGAPASVPHQMGGAIQGGVPLTLNGQVTTIAGVAGSPGAFDGTGSSARFQTPVGATTDGANLYIADYRNQIIRKMVIATGAVTTLAGTAGGSGSADGVGAAARFLYPSGITTNGAALFITDQGNHTVRKLDLATNSVTTLAGTAGSAGSADGIGAAARFDTPMGITTDGANLYVADYGDHTIRKIVIATGAVTTLAGSAGAAGAADGTGSAARFFQPSGITTDGTSLYVADYGNDTIRKIAIATSVVTTLAGSAGSAGGVDGSGSVARFNGPAGIASDGTNLYVTDYGDDTVRKVTIADGMVTTLAGSAGSVGSADGTGGAAQFYLPFGVTGDGAKLYVVDYGNSTIRAVR